jgi:S-layer protein
MYQALYGNAPSNGLYNSYIDSLAASSPAAFAATLAGNFANVSDTDLALQVLNNLGVTATTVTATGEYTKLLTALGEAFAAFPTMRGQVILNATNLFANLESDATYGAAAITYNKQALANFTYASNTANTAPGTAALPDPTIGTTYTLTTSPDTVTGTSANDTFNGTTNNNSWSAFDSITGGLGNDTLNVLTSNSADPAGITLTGVETLNINSTAGGYTTDTTGYTGLTAVSVVEASNNAVVITAAATTAVTASTLTAAMTVTGGLSQTTVNAGGDATLSGSVGAVNVTATAMGSNDVVVNGGTSVTVAETGVTNLGLLGIGATSAPTGAVVVTSSGDYTTGGGAVGRGAITIKGGTTVSVTQTTGITAAETTAALTNTGGNSTLTQAAVTVTGTATTTAVTVSNAATVAVSTSVTTGKIGVAQADITVNDKNAASATAAGTITSVTATNFDDLAVNSGALSTVTVAGKGATITLTDGALTTPTATTLQLNLAGITVSGATSVDSDYTTVNIASSSATNTLTGGLAANGATTVGISGDKSLVLATHSFAAAANITSTSTGAVKISDALAVAQTYTGAAGADTITVGATTKAITTGAGDDIVTVSVDFGAGGTVDAGDGTGDILSITSANAATLSALTTFDAKISNFEVINLGATAGADTVDVTNLDDISTVISAGVTAGGLALQGLGATNLVTFTAAVGAASSIALATSTGTTDVVNVKLSADDGFTNTGALTISNVETINIATEDSDTSTDATMVYTVPLTAAAAKTITLTGAIGVNLSSATGTALTSFNASGVTGTGAVGQVTLTTGALAAAAVITGGAGDDVLNAASATKAVTMSGGAGGDVLTGGTLGDNISGGDGVDRLDGGAGGDTLTGGAGTDVFHVTTVTDSNGVNQDTVADFVAGTDKIASATSAITYLGEANGYGAVLTSLSGTANQAVLDTSTSTLYIDVNGDNALTLLDITMSLTGIVDLSQSDFAIAGSVGGDALTGGTLADYIYGFAGSDTITGGAGSDVMSGGAGADTFAFTTASTGLPSATKFDTITDYTKAAGASFDTISATNLTLGVQTAAAGSGVATITAGVATFNAADTTFAQHLAAVAAAQDATAGATTVWQEGTDTYMYISDGTLAVAATDVLIKLVGVTAGALTVAGNAVTAMA